MATYKKQNKKIPCLLCIAIPVSSVYTSIPDQAKTVLTMTNLTYAIPTPNHNANIGDHISHTCIPITK